MCVRACISSRGFLRLPIWEQALGVKHSGAGGEDSVSLEDTAQPAQRSLEHPHIYTHRPTNALMYPCTHTDTVPLSLLYIHRHTHCFSVPSPSHPLYFACTDAHTHREHSLCSSPLSSFVLSKLHRGVRKAAVRGIMGNQLKQFTVVTL